MLHDWIAGEGMWFDNLTGNMRDMYSWSRCAECGGTGELQDAVFWDGDYMPSVVVCYECQGEGLIRMRTIGNE